MLPRTDSESPSSESQAIELSEIKSNHPIPTDKINSLNIIYKFIFPSESDIVRIVTKSLKTNKESESKKATEKTDKLSDPNNKAIAIEKIVEKVLNKTFKGR